MNSFFARNRLSAYLDHSLPRDEAEAVAITRKASVGMTVTQLADVLLKCFSLQTS